MARRSIRKRRHTPRQRFVDGCADLAELYDRADRAFLAQAAAYEQWATDVGNAVLEAMLGRRDGMRADVTARRAGKSEATRMMARYSKNDFERVFGWDVPDVVSFGEFFSMPGFGDSFPAEPCNPMTVVSVDHDAGTFTVD